MFWRTTVLKKTRDPFGQADCESELKMLKSEYSKLYFDEAPFNATAIDSETYLIIGRRGSGKTALSQFFSFQKVVEDPIYIDVDEPAAYQQVLADIAARASESREIAIPRLMRIWEYVIWRLLFERTSSESPAIAAACGTGFKRHSVSQIVNGIIEHLLTTFHDANGKYMASHMEQLLTEEGLKAAKAEVLEIAAKRSIIIAIDTLEKYDIDNAALVNAMAALIQSAAE